MSQPWRAPRYRVELQAEVLPIVYSVARGIETLSPLKGYTRDISESGIALIVPAIRIGGNYLMAEGRVLEIKLTLPDSKIMLHARPVRYERVFEQENWNGYLIGAQITQVSDEDFLKYQLFLNSLK
jgi:hypothetical protein